MIAERFPELKTLNPEEQLELASELAHAALDSDDFTELSPQAIELLEKRLEYFNENPSTGVSWDDLKTKRDG